MLRVEIRVKALVDEQWSEWFEGLKMRHTEGDETILSGLVVDQASLHGLLAKVRDLNLALVSFTAAEVDCSSREE